CCSSGASTVSEMTSAEAPGYCTPTLIVGGAIGGNCATGSCGYANAPTSVITIAMTLAKIGRSTKKCVRRISLRRAAGRAALRHDRAGLRHHGRAGARALLAVDDDAVRGR